MKKHIPNFLTILRIAISPVLLYLLCVSGWSKPGDIYLYLSIVLFIFAAITDLLDGYLSRKWNVVSSFGKVFDPLADKVLVIGVMILAMYHKYLYLSIGTLLIIRDIVMDILRFYFYKYKKIVIPASISAKIKTVLNMLSVLILLFSVIFISPDFYIQIPFILTLIFSIYSFIRYIIRIWILFKYS